MAPVAELATSEARVPTTLAWVIDKSPTYAFEGNILSSGATLAWAADLLTDGSVADLVALAETVPDQWQVQIQAKIQNRARVAVHSDHLDPEQLRSAHLEHCPDVAAAVLAEGPEAQVCALPEGPQTIPHL